MSAPKYDVEFGAPDSRSHVGGVWTQRAQQLASGLASKRAKTIGRTVRGVQGDDARDNNVHTIVYFADHQLAGQGDVLFFSMLHHSQSVTHGFKDYEYVINYKTLQGTLEDIVGALHEFAEFVWRDSSENPMEYMARTCGQAQAAMAGLNEKEQRVVALLMTLQPFGIVNNSDNGLGGNTSDIKQVVRSHVSHELQFPVGLGCRHTITCVKAFTGEGPLVRFRMIADGSAGNAAGGSRWSFRESRLLGVWTLGVLYKEDISALKHPAMYPLLVCMTHPRLVNFGRAKAFETAFPQAARAVRDNPALTEDLARAVNPAKAAARSRGGTGGDTMSQAYAQLGGMP